MPKVLLVEDDNNLREIFQMRLEAEGYQVVTAADGEEGLVVAMKEKPDLLIADVMMPKLSGFEMIENLRSSPEMKDVKVVMMTALGQAEDQARGEKLGVVKYLVKSQVTLEDFARVVKEVLGPGSPKGASASGQVENASTKSQGSEKAMQDQPSPTNPAPAGDSSAPAEPAAPSSNPMSDAGQQSSSDEQAGVQNQIDNFAGNTPAGDSSAPAEPAADTSAPSMPPAAEPPAAPSEPPAGTDQPPAAPPTDPTSNAL